MLGLHLDSSKSWGDILNLSFGLCMGGEVVLMMVMSQLPSRGTILCARSLVSVKERNGGIWMDWSISGDS